MTKQEVIEYCLSLQNTSVDSPFDEDFETCIARHCDNSKWFTIIMMYQNRQIVTVKCEPMQADFYRSVYESVIPAYHMNKKHWNTIFLDGDVPDEELKAMICDSYDLTAKKVRKKNGE